MRSIYKCYDLLGDDPLLNPAVTLIMTLGENILFKSKYEQERHRFRKDT